MARRERLAALVLALPGVVAPFLPFTYGLSPLNIIVRSDIHPDLHLFFLLLFTPTFLAIPIAAWQARRCAVGRLSSIEIALAYGFSAAATLCALVIALGLLVENVSDPASNWAELVFGSLLFATPSGLAGANIILLLRNLRKPAPRKVSAEAFLLGGYFPATAVPLILFIPETLGSSGEWSSLRLQPGSFFVLIAWVAYFRTIVLLLRGKAN